MQEHPAAWGRMRQDLCGIRRASGSACKKKGKAGRAGGGNYGSRRNRFAAACDVTAGGECKECGGAGSFALWKIDIPSLNNAGVAIKGSVEDTPRRKTGIRVMGYKRKRDVSHVQIYDPRHAQPSVRKNCQRGLRLMRSWHQDVGKTF